MGSMGSMGSMGPMMNRYSYTPTSMEEGRVNSVHHSGPLTVHKLE
jgi:hypothetical protein